MEKKENVEEGNYSYRSNMEEIQNDVILNISGGYKAIIPYITILGQLYKMPINYIYEDREELIKIENLPIQFDWDFAEKYYPYMSDIHSLKNNSNKDVSNELKEYKLIRFNIEKNSYELTALGEFFKQYIEYEMPIAKSVMGYFIEYKLYEYFILNNYKDKDGIIYNKVYHSVKEKWTGNKELDLVIKDEKDSRFIVMESKSYYQIVNNRSFDKVKGQITKQLELLLRNDQIPKEYQLFIYSNSRKGTARDLKEKLNEIKKLIFISTECIFKAFFIRVDYSHYYKDEKGKFKENKNPYQNFMSKALKQEDIEEINL